VGIIDRVKKILLVTLERTSFREKDIQTIPVIEMEISSESIDNEQFANKARISIEFNFG
jgi:hypothetical protein